MTSRLPFKATGRLVEMTAFERFPMTTSQAQKVVVITGASQGIGAGLVEAYRKLGYGVVATSRSIEPANDPDIVTVRGDIADADTAARIVDAALERFGQIGRASC